MLPPRKTTREYFKLFFCNCYSRNGPLHKRHVPVCHQNQITNSEVRLRTQLFLSLLECRQALFRLSAPKFVCEKMNIFHIWTCLTLQTQLDKRMGVYVFGVSAFKSCWSLDTKVIGLSFKIFSISTKSIHKASSLSSRSPINEYKILLINHISLSYTPPWCLANGGSNLHSIPFLVKVDPLLIPHF